MLRRQIEMSNICPICKSRAVVDGLGIEACYLCASATLLDHIKEKHANLFDRIFRTVDVEVKVYYNKMWQL